MIGLTIYSRLYEEAQPLVESDSILVVGGRVQVRSDGSREVVADRLTRIDEVLGTWVRDVYLPMDLQAAGQAGVEALGAIFARFDQPCPLRPLGGTLPADQAEPAAATAAPVAPGCSADTGGGGAPDTGDEPAWDEPPAADPGDPDLAPAAVLAKPVPLVVEVERDGRTWLIRSGGRSLALTLDSLRALRQVPGARGLRLRAELPAPVERKMRFGRG